MTGKKKAEKNTNTQENKEEESIKNLENEKNALDVTVTLLKERIKQLNIENDKLNQNLKELNLTLKKSEEDCADILEHNEKCLAESREKIFNLENKNENLNKKLINYEEEIEKLKKEKNEAISEMKNCDVLLKEKSSIEAIIRDQSDLIQNQNQEIKNSKIEISTKNEKLKLKNEEINELKFQTQDKTQIKIIFDDIFIIKTRKRKLKGTFPIDRSSGTLTNNSGKNLILMGGIHPGYKLLDNIYLLNLIDLTWTEISDIIKLEKSKFNFTTLKYSRNKLINFGGIITPVVSSVTQQPMSKEKELLTSEINILNIETKKWLDIKLFNETEEPEAISGHSSCILDNKMYVFGGDTAAKDLINELWCLDLDIMAWSKIECQGDLPCPRSYSAIISSIDKKRIYLFGGCDGLRLLNDLYVFDIEKKKWKLLNIKGIIPEERCNHKLNIINNYLLIFGGTGHQSNKDKNYRALSDIYILDTQTKFCDIIDNELSWMSPTDELCTKYDGCYMASNDKMIYCLRCDKNEILNEIKIVELIIPEDIEKLKSQNDNHNKYREKLEIVNVEVTCTSIFVRWLAPTKNIDRIEKYKLMMGSTSGIVKEVYSGKNKKFKAVSLKPNSEYIFCVKAIYDDNSFIWSDSKAFKTT